MQELFNHIDFTAPIAFAMTYLLHSTIWVLIVGILVRTTVLNSLSIKNYLWKAALIGGILTSIFSTIFHQNAFSITLNEQPSIEISIDNNLENVSPTLAPLNLETSNNNINTKATSEKSNWSWETIISISLKYLVLFWILGTTFLFLKLTVDHWIFFRKINPRKNIQSTSIISLFYKIRKKSNTKKYIALSQSDNLNSPILIGDSEICLPTKAIQNLDDTQMEGMIAHELAHIARKDYYWTLGITLLQSVFFFQPLNRYAIRKIKNTNELLCDAWAANITGNNLALAKCLLTVAEWVKHKPYSHTLVAGMSLKKSELSERIQSLINLPDLGKQRYDLAKTGLIFSGFLFFCFVIIPGFTLETIPPPRYQTISFSELENMHPKAQCNILLQAVQDKNVKRVKELVTVINPNCSYCVNGFPSSPFTTAASIGSTEVGDVLLKYGADIYYTAEEEGSAAYYAAQNGQTEFMKLIKCKGGNLNYTRPAYESPLEIATKNKQTAMVQYLQKNIKQN